MSSSQDIIIDKLFICNPAYARTISDIYFDAAASRERVSQQLFILTDVNPGIPRYDDFLEAVIEEGVSAFEGATHPTPELVLETVLEAVNRIIPAFAGTKSDFFFNNVSILIGVSEHGQIHFSQWGAIKAFLIQTNGLISEVSESAKAINPLKAFSHITSGLMNPGDVLLCTTTSLIDYIAEDKIKELALKYPPNQTIQQLHALLAEVPSSVSFASIFIKFATENDYLMQSRTPQEATSSITAPASADLTPNPLATSRTHPDETPSTQTTSRTRQRIAAHAGFGSYVKLGLRFFLRNARQYILILGALFHHMARIAHAAVKSLLSNRNRTANEKLLIKNIYDTVLKARGTYQGLTKSARRAVIAVLVIMVILLHFFVLKGQEQEVKKTESAFNETLRLVADKRVQANNAFIYNDERRAEQLYIEIDFLLKSVAPLNKQDSDALATYLAENERDLNKVRHINFIENPFSYAELGSISTADASPTSIIEGPEGPLVSIGSAIYRIKDTPEKIVEAPSSLQHLIASGEQKIYAITTDATLYLFEKNLLSKQGASLSSAEIVAVAPALYAGNLYTLNASEGAIIRHTSNQNSFGNSSVWLSDTDLLSTANSIAIDGAIYVITRDGAIVKLIKGERQDFRAGPFNPSLGSSTKIYTSLASSFLYILDRDNKRIIILNKDGSIKDQFTSPRFDDLKDLAPNADEDTLSILNGTTIYLLAIQK